MGLLWTAEYLLPLYGTLSAMAMGFLWTVIPKEFYFRFQDWNQKFQQRFTYYANFEVQEFCGAGSNEIYDYVQSYLSSNTAIAANFVNVARPKNASCNTFWLGRNETIEDTFMGSTFKWTHVVADRSIPSKSWSETPDDEIRKYHLKVRKADKDRVLNPYLQHVIDTAKLVKEKSRDRLLYTNMKESSTWHPFRQKVWQSVPFKNPSTFKTLAMDPVVKDEIMKDLTDFTEGKEFYEMAGKAWKRGYLLHGPPGTGKSSMIAAIANFLKYDIYDLELTEVKSNCALRNLLIQTTDRSILVIEDIDCTAELSERAKPAKEEKKEKPDEEKPSRMTLSGVLNFTDGLWSSCGSERIIIFTTNHMDKLDPALLRTGRMDKKIHMSYCKFPAFRTLAKNNLRIEWHEDFPKIEQAMANKAMSPADVSELLLAKRDDPSAALESLLEALAIAPLASDSNVKAASDEIKLDHVINGTGLADANPPAADDSGSETTTELSSQENGEEK